MENRRFDYNEMYTATELADMFEFPIYVRRDTYYGNYVYKITSVAGLVFGEGWKNGSFDKYITYGLGVRFYVCFNPKPVFKKKTNGITLFPVVVMATMSSGKSTLLNVLLNKNILPSSNSACTAKSYRIFDNDNDELTEIEFVYNDGKKETIACDDWASRLREANENPEIIKVIIRTQIQGVFNTRNRLVLVDTPGTNNSQDESHGQITLDILSKITDGLIVYIINATQFGINDDRNLLLRVREAVSKNKNLRVAFVVNKCDEREEEKGESLETIVADVYDYLVKDCGFYNPDIIPTSALVADIIQKAMRHERLTKKEIKKFNEYLIMNFEDIQEISSPEEVNGETFCDVGGIFYRLYDLKRMFESTGIPRLEKYIEEAKNIHPG